LDGDVSPFRPAARHTGIPSAGARTTARCVGPPSGNVLPLYGRPCAYERGAPYRLVPDGVTWPRQLPPPSANQGTNGTKVVSHRPLVWYNQLRTGSCKPLNPTSLQRSRGVLLLREGSLDPRPSRKLDGRSCAAISNIAVAEQAKPGLPTFDRICGGDCLGVEGA
jgi:hypothetical protein